MERVLAAQVDDGLEPGGLVNEIEMAVLAAGEFRFNYFGRGTVERVEREGHLESMDIPAFVRRGSP